MVRFREWAAVNLGQGDAVFLETTGNVWDIYDIVAPRVTHTVVAHVGTVWQIAEARVETDSEDIKRLLRLLIADTLAPHCVWCSAGQVPEVWVPPAHVRELRALISYLNNPIVERYEVSGKICFCETILQNKKQQPNVNQSLFAYFKKSPRTRHTSPWYPFHEWYNFRAFREMIMLNLQPSVLFAHLFTLVIAFTLHEFAHAWTADYFGDDTPRSQGRLTLNPLAHLDPIGSLLLIFAGFGWARPVMVNPYLLRQRSPHAMMLVSLAGPVSNLLMAIAAAIPFRLGWLQVESSSGGMIPTLNYLWTEFIWLNLILMLFNLLPIAPLDGDKIFSHFLPPTAADWFETIRPYGPMVLMVLMFAGGGLLGSIIGTPARFLFWSLVGQ